MAINKGINSYVTVEEADIYFEDRLDVAAWSEASETAKGQALVTATGMLDTYSWVGVIETLDQELAFPRSGSFFDPKLGFETQLDPAKVPTRILNATYELAYHLLNNDGLLDDTGSVKSMSIGAISFSDISSTSKIPSAVNKLIRPLLINGGRNLWWRAN